MCTCMHDVCVFVCVCMSSLAVPLSSTATEECDKVERESLVISGVRCIMCWTGVRWS